MKIISLVLVLLPFWAQTQVPSADFRFIGRAKVYTELAIHSNLAPVHMGEYSFGANYIRGYRWRYHLTLGHAPNPKFGTRYKIEKDGWCDVGNGSFAKLGLEYHIFKASPFFRKKTNLFNPSVGLRIVASRVNELVLENPWDSIVENKTSMNYGAALTLANTTKLYKRFSIKLGIQLGKDIIINREYEKFGYTPGLGIFWDSGRTQLIGELSYVIHRGIRRGRIPNWVN